jgi:tether containing UBX domain for GLUT4
MRFAKGLRLKLPTTISSKFFSTLATLFHVWKFRSLVGAKLTSIRHNTKIIDLSKTYRQSGLPPGATLELVAASRSAGVVMVGLQVPPDGNKLIDKFPSSTTLWQILRKFESTAGPNLNFTGRGTADIQNGTSSGAGRIFYEMPCLNVLGRECSTFGDLQKTLQQLGINSGSASVRLSFKKTEQPLEEAVTEIAQYFKEEDAHQLAAALEADAANAEEARTAQGPNVVEPASGSFEPSGSTETGSTNISQDIPEATSQNSATSPHVLEGALTPLSSGTSPEPTQRPVNIYRASSSDTPKAVSAPHNEADYEPQLAHLSSTQGRLAKSAQNKRLPSDAEIDREEQEKAAKIAAMKQIVVRIRFPDQNIAEPKFETTDNAVTLYNLARSLIIAEDQPFKLVYTGNKGPVTIPMDEKKQLVKHFGFDKRTLVNFVWESGASASARRGPTLKAVHLKVAKELPVPEVNTIDEKGAPNTDPGKEGGDGGGSKKGKGGMPAWLTKGLSKK